MNPTSFQAYIVATRQLFKHFDFQGSVRGWLNVQICPMSWVASATGFSIRVIASQNENALVSKVALTFLQNAKIDSFTVLM